jgi:cytochrome oxidase Cu insertion factor (SCO1/SenC/PrrC family)
MALRSKIRRRGTLTQGDSQPPVPLRRRSTWRDHVLLGTVTAVVLAGATAVFAMSASAYNPTQLPSANSDIPASVSASLANLMELSPLPSITAPNFTLRDQFGREISLSDLRGNTVVLEFMDPHCTDICPLVSQEFVDAYHDLGPAASKVVFVAINVNKYFRSVKSMKTYSQEHGLDEIPSWHFLTGSVQSLEDVWHDYGSYVSAPNPNADIIHSSVVYFIGPSGFEQYAASPTDDHTANGAAYLPTGSLASWGRGIALVANALGH